MCYGIVVAPDIVGVATTSVRLPWKYMMGWKYTVGVAKFDDHAAEALDLY